MAYTDAEIQSLKEANNISDNYVPVRTALGGVVFVDAANATLIQAYQSGQLTGGEPAPAGVALRGLPTPPPPPPAPEQPRTVATINQPRPTVSVPVAPPVLNNNKVTQTVIRRSAQVPILVEIIAKPLPIKAATKVEVKILPAETPQQVKNIPFKFNLNIIPIRINISEPLIATAKQFLTNILDVYVDEERELKTLLNYGEDRQSVAIAYRRGPVDINGIDSIQLKLIQPVPDDVALNDNVFLSREVSKTVIDKVRLRFAPPLDATPYLRPKNVKVKTDVDTGRFLRNVTLNKLSLQSGSVGRTDINQNKTFEDEIFRQWYSYDFNSSELNIDFTNYSNFVFYSSAAMRLAAFKQKLEQIERLERSRNQILASYTANTASAGFIYVQEKSAEYALEKENIIRSFDRYEQYLFFTATGSNSAYSASFDYVDGGVEYNSIGYWPKSGSNLYAVNSDVAVNWYASQSAIAQRFDEFNENNLVNTIPSYLREDHSSAAYLTFVTMVGQLFDNIKLYIDQFSNVYSRNLNPNEELSKDLVNEIAESLGFVLPTIDSVYNLTDNILGTVSTEPRRDLAAEIYKRLLHNLPFFAKAKGTKTALEAMLNTFGITQQLLSVKETGTPVTSSYKVLAEYTTGLDFDQSKISYITVPISASNRTPIVLQFNCTVAKNGGMTILTGDDKWALNVVRHPTNETLGKFVIASGSADVSLISSSYYPIFGDELLNITIKNYQNTSSFYFTQTDAEDILFNQKVITNAFSALWNSTQYIYLGGSGSRVQTRYDGTLDEVRLWGTSLSDETILATAFNPMSNAGDVYTDASDYLYVKLSFDNVSSASLAANTVINETPYKDISVSPSLETLTTFNIQEADFTRYSRTTKHDVPLIGSSAHITNKITVAPPPKFVSDSTGLRLYRNKSIVRPEVKKFSKGRGKVILAMKPSDAINDNIINNFGMENINEILGVPTELYKKLDKNLQILQEHYQQYYYIDVNKNKYIRIMSDLSSVLNQIVDYFIPSKATLLNGVVIDSNILEEHKIKPLKDIRTYGKNARRTLKAAGSLTGSAPEYAATYNVETTLDREPTTLAKYDEYKSTLDFDAVLDKSSYAKYETTVDSVETNILAKYSKYTSSLNLENKDLLGEYTVTKADVTEVTPEVISNYNTVKSINLEKDNVPLEVRWETLRTQHQPYGYAGLEKPSAISVDTKDVNKVPYNNVNNGSPGAEPYNRLYTRKLFTSEIKSERFAGTSSTYLPALYDIPPSADFRDFGVYTFFNSEDSIYYFNETKKLPVYPSELNATWDFGNQNFGNTITTWSFGAGYNKFDVVYQDVTDDTFNLSTRTDTESIIYLRFKSLVKSSNGGNGRYYVFKNRPPYSTPSGSVSSYVPPSLDRRNWDVLRFKPIQVRVPKRVVFDTFTFNDPIITNYKTTTISVDKNITLPNRFIDAFEIKTVAANSYTTGEFLVQNLAILFAIQANVSNIRLRLYRTQTARDADISRDIYTRPTNSHGVMLDTLLSGTNISEIANPFPTLVAGDVPTNGKIHYTIDNLSSTSLVDIRLLFYYFAVEIQPRIPIGYLQKHYRFFRDNSTALKRRNYLGCKNTQETTIDGLPPVQVFVGEGTDIQVAATSLNTEIITGGGGTLDVT